MTAMQWRSALAVLVTLVVGGASPPPTSKVIYTFKGGSDGYYPQGGLIADRRGALYGTTIGGGTNEQQGPDTLPLGTVFKLTPNWREGTWTKSTLYSFRAVNDGRTPDSTLVADAQGALYGSTVDDGLCGASTIFKLTPPASARGAWTEQIVHDFCYGPGVITSVNGLTIDRHGVLYGTGVVTNEHDPDPGVVFRLAPPSNGQSAWTETDIYNFPDTRLGSAPWGGVIVDRQGALYGAAFQNGVFGFGTVFKLTPPAAGQTGWTATALHQFAGGSDGAAPMGGLVADRAGALYGTTSNGGVVCGTSTFGDPVSCGTVFRLTPPAAGQASWAHDILYSFKGGKDGGVPETPLRRDWRGTLYGTTITTVFSLKPPSRSSAAWTEAVLYRTTVGLDPVLVTDWGSRLFVPTAEDGTGCPGTYYTPPGCGTVVELPLRGPGLDLRGLGGDASEAVTETLSLRSPDGLGQPGGP